MSDSESSWDNDFNVVCRGFKKAAASEEVVSIDPEEASFINGNPEELNNLAEEAIASSKLPPTLTQALEDTINDIHPQPTK